MQKKDRKHSGWVTPLPSMRKRELIADDIFLDDYYDDWKDWRDGMRDWYSDFKMIKNIHFGLAESFLNYDKRVRMNNKQRSLLRRRKARIQRKREIISDDVT